MENEKQILKEFCKYLLERRIVGEGETYDPLTWIKGFETTLTDEKAMAADEVLVRLVMLKLQPSNIQSTKTKSARLVSLKLHDVKSDDCLIINI